ncbi:HET-domain-containing protein [Tothia fuscella]|uniref:HET-domain-containing protein n=1 Tax=Tothia fuscella TaxID=1048955 RepID=A0A9P4NS19_9PEZI|nr:HET-domain-containing protein [Tothia fuscella]
MRLRMTIHAGIAEESADSTGHPLVLEQAKSWVDSCMEQHDLCDRARDGSWYPARLIDVVSGRLVSTADHTPSGPYIALSYCWGENPSFLTLTAANLTQWTVAIPATDLPLGFKQAMEVASRLNVRYLWIDALCIVQSGSGSVEDWHCQSAQMRHVYSNCLFTIAVSHANKPEEGLFCSRDGSLYKPLRLKIVTTDTLTPRYWQLECFGKFDEELDRAPLTRRGWVLQERLLSPRILTFGCKAIYWDCAAEEGKTETGSDSAIRHPFGISRSSLHTLIEVYTSRNLTSPMDRLVAFSAIAETKAPSRPNNRYFAGHFREELPKSLLWYASTHLEKPAIYVAPSWSWAAAAGYHQFIDGPFTTSKHDAKVVHVHVDLMDEVNQYGQVSGGFIRIEGCIARVAFVKKSVENHLWFYFDYKHCHERSWDSYLFLLIATTEDGVRDLILDKTTSGKEDHFQRVGFAKFWPEKSEEWLEQLERRLVTIV